MNIYCTKQEKPHDNHQFQLPIIDFNHKQLIPCMILFDGRAYLPFHIATPKRDEIEKFHFKIVNNCIQQVIKHVW